MLNGLTKVANKLLEFNSKVKSSEWLKGDFLKVPEKLKKIFEEIPQLGDKIKDAFSKIKETIQHTF